jgi:hypothetical protein
MTLDPPNSTLLLAGWRDLLPPGAVIEVLAVAALMGVFAVHG